MNSKYSDIAVIGMAGRFPGAQNVSQFWENICQGRESVRRLSDDELKAAGVSDKKINDKSYVKVAPTIEHIDKFDASFFKVSPAEAQLLDPQLRLLLQCAWETLEDAGVATSDAQNIGVFTGAGGVTTNYFSHFINQNTNFEKITAGPAHLGNDKDFLSTYISYKLNLTGPSITVQTACSTSLVALHQACLSLRNGECDMAMAGGVTIRVPHIEGYHHKEGHIVSSSGHVKTFDESADGTIFGSGLGLVLVKKLADAVADGNHIYAVIKGSAITNDGKAKLSYAASSARGQIRCITTALDNANVDPGTIGFVETHGTGTYMGDPEEVKALTSAFKKQTDAKGFCAVGAVKTNVGHLEAAAGITGFIKAVLSLHHGFIPPTINFEKPNPRIKFEKTPFYVNSALQQWPSVDGPRRAAVNSLGVGGTNAFVILEQYQASEAEQEKLVQAKPVKGQSYIIPLSAKTKAALVGSAQRLADYIDKSIAARPWQKRQLDIAQLAYTMQMGRAEMDHKMAIVADDLEQLRDHLLAYIDGETSLPQHIVVPRDEETQEQQALFGIDDDVIAVMKQWLADKHWSQLALAWVEEHELEWQWLHEQQVRPQLASLPTYDFAKDRHWVESGQIALGQSYLHPLLHVGSSDLSQQSYNSNFDGSEFFLVDHQINPDNSYPRKVLPGVGYIEMARSAIEEALPPHLLSKKVMFHHIVWLQPMEAEQALDVTIALFTEEDEEQIEFEVYSLFEEQNGEQQILIHCQGQATLIEQPMIENFDLEQFKKQMQGPVYQTGELYPALAHMGLNYGPSFQGLKTVWVGDEELLAEIELPPEALGYSSEFVLHPTMLDSALQATNVLAIDVENPPEQPLLPFALEEVNIYAKPRTRMFAWVKYSEGHGAQEKVLKLDISLMDKYGNLCVSMNGFTARVAVSDQQQDAEITGSLFATPVWQPSDIGRADENQPIAEIAQHHLMVCDLPKVDMTQLAAQFPQAISQSWQPKVEQNLAQNYSEFALQLFNYIKQTLVAKPEGNQFVQLVLPYRKNDNIYAGVFSLLKSAKLENPKLIGQVVLVDEQLDTATLAQQLAKAKARTDNFLVKCEQGIWEVLDWQALPASLDNPPTFNPAKSAYNDYGIYLITGGLGGLGRLFAEEILTQTSQAKVILTGRSSSEKIASNESAQSHLNALGPRASYQALDLANADEVNLFIQKLVAQEGRLNGIIHSAGMNHDNFIVNKTEQEFLQVLAPKVQGTYNLDHASREVDLDFMVLFSSLTSAIGNLGQTDYAAANGFMDQFAMFRNNQVNNGERRGRTLAINWSLWAEGGMGQDEEAKKILRQTTGIEPMRTETGMLTFYRSLALNLEQTVIMEGDLEKIQHTILDLESDDAASGSASPEQAFVENLVEKTEAYLCKQLADLLKMPAYQIDPAAQMDKYGINSIMAIDLTNLLEQSFGRLSKTLFFEYQTISELASYFINSHAAQLSGILAQQPALSGAGEAGADDNHAADVAAEQSSHAASSSKNVHAISLNGHSKGRRSRGQRLAPNRSLPAPRVATQAADIAIIGLSGRYPQAQNIGEYWQKLRDGVDCITEVPHERWDWHEYFSADRTVEGHHFSKWGGFIDGVDLFDSRFFNISPREAETIDPQERLFLEHAWMAIEDAGITRDGLQIPFEKNLPGQVGVYAGVMYGEYQLLGVEASNRGQRMGFASNLASIANRVSFVLNVHGPSMTIDTMCSSSLTAIHVACQDLKQGHTSLALAGGVNVTVHPNKYLMLSSGQFISSDGHCQSFGEGGDGYIPAEGVGVVVLKRLDEAEADNHHIYGIIRGTSLSHGGRTNGYTVPNPQAQAAAISRALIESNIDPRHISYVEAHGTGTKLGDPIEIAALNKAFYQHDFPSSKAVKATGFCDIGSAKSNIGHAESAAGIAGLTKILLQMKYGKVVPSLHSARLNPHIDFDDSPFVVNQELKDWSRPVIEGRNIPRIAGLSSFGAGGSNAHMIIEEYQPLQHPEIYKVGEVIVVLSARTLDQLREQAKQLLHFVRTEQHLPNLVDLAYTLQVGREAMGERMAIVASSIEILEQKLQAVIESSEAKGLDKELHLEDVYIDQVKANRKSVSLISQDEDMVEAIDKWIRRSKLAKLSELWVKGMPLEWLKLYREQKPQLISLPTYPFAKTRCWVEIPKVESQAKMGAERIHPLLHRNESNLHQYGFGSRFSGEELFFNAGRLGVGAYVEMARAAIDHVTDDKDASIELFQLAFGESYLASQLKEEKKEKEQREQQDVAIALMPSGSNGHTQIGFEIYSDDTVHAQGKARFVSSTALIAVDLAQLTAKAAKDPSQLCTTVSVAAQLQNSADFAEDVKQYQIIPQLLDTALTQALNLDARLGQMPLPVSLKSLQIYYPCKTAMTAWARPSVSGAELEYDIDLINDFGHICVSLKGLRYELKAVAQPQAEPQTKPVAGPVSEVITKPVAAVSKPQTVATSVQAPVTTSIRKLALDLSAVNLTVSTETPSEDIALSTLAKPSDIVLVEPASLERTEQLKDQPILAKGTINLVAPLDTPKVLGAKTVIAGVVPSAPSDNLSKPIFNLSAPALLPDAVKNQSLLAKPVFALAAVDANRSVSNQTQPQAPASLDIATIKRRIELLDKGNGVFSILLNHDVLDIEMIVALSAALKQLKAESQLNVVTIESQSGLSANRGQSDFAITYGLYAQLADFAHTIVVMIEGDLTGGGFMLALLADFMVLNANATIELAQTNPSEVSLLNERFGQVLAYHLLYIANKQSAAWLAQQGLNVDVVDKAEVNRTGYQLVDHFVSKSAQNGNKPNRALSLLKRHLMLDSKAYVDQLVADEPIVDNKNEVGNDKPEITSPAKHIELNRQGDVAHVHIGVAKGRYGVKALLSHLQSVLTQLSSSRCRAIVLSSDYQQFLPQASSYPKTDILVAYRELILDCQIPVVVALTQGADSVSWPIALVADGCIYSNQGQYQVDNWWVDETHAKTCAVIFQHRLSERVAKALLLANQSHSGLSLMAEQPALLSFEADKVLSQALDLAAHWSRFDDSQLLAFKRQQSELIKQKLTAVNWQLGANDFEPVANKTALPLDSQVISATIDSDGVVVITMADKEAKNMFSDAFTAGMNQVFAHIAQSKQAKVVVMTGFDNYFAAGGNKDMLLAIQKGEVKFTDNKIFEVATKCPLPVIAAMQGHGIGAGWVLGMNAEISILAEQSQYFSPYMNYGFTPGAGSTYVFRQKVGLDLTRRSLMTGFELNGSRWQALGLMQSVLPRKEVLTTAIQMAQQIAKLERNVLIAAKALWNSGLATQLDRTYELELEMHQQTFVGDAQTLATIETNFGAQSEAQTQAQDQLLAQPQTLLQLVAVPAAAVATAPVTTATTNKVATDLTTISAHLRDLLAQELRLSSDEIDDDSEFVELGLDSITGVTWIRKINEHYHTNIEAIKVYSYPTLAQLSVFVRDEAQAQTQDIASPAMPEAQAEPVAQVQAEPVVQATPVVVEATTDASSNSDISFAQVNDQLKSLLADELRLDLDEIDQDSEFVDLGLDSITGVTWIRKINEIYGTDIEAIKVYSYPTLSQLTSFVLEQAQSNQAPVQEPVQIAATSVAPTIAPKTVPQPKVETQAAVATVSVAQIEAQLRSLLADELRLEQDEIDSDVEFVDLGLDSITGVTWIRKINEIYGTDIEAIKVYSYPNLTQLSRFVQQEAGLPAVAAPVAAVAPAVAPVTEMEAPAPQVVSQPVATAPAGELVVNRLKSWRKTKLEHHSQQDVAEIAIIGMSGQFPMANDLNQYWQNIAQGKNCISEISEKRWSLADYYQQGTPVPGKTYSKWMGELDQFDLFDNEFFNITPKEAKTMDPQQRMFLQTCWAAIENAGFDPSSLSGSNCGVFAGCAVGDYHQFSQKHQLSALGFTGNESSMLAARISYYLNLVGPSMSINTACSSSLVAISNACDSLTQANCDIALAGGVNVMAGPSMLIKSAQAGMLSKDGRCFTFDQRANGFVAGEGVGAILLKRLTDAERDNDAIIGVIRGWGVNQDGKTNGITAPNADSQTALQQSVFGRFGINPEDIQLIEAHGTGTALGDPIEVAGLKASFKPFTENTAYCALGSVKSNIGHCLTAAGVAGVIKLLLAIQAKQLPPTINYQQLNEHIRLDNSPFYVNDQLQQWQVASGQARQAMISSFGFGGTNGCAVIAEYQQQSRATVSHDDVVILLSAKTPTALKQQAEQLVDFVQHNQHISLADIAFTLQTGRQMMSERLGFVAATLADVENKLTQFIASNNKGLYQGQVQSKQDPLVALSKDSDFQDTLDRWISSRKLSKLLEFWAKGLDLDWMRLYQGSYRETPHRIALPSYPFAKTRHWLDDSQLAASAINTTSAPQSPTLDNTASGVIHRLVHRNTSDLMQQSYTSLFSAQEPLFAQQQYDDQGQNKGLMSALAYIEVARVALEQAMPEVRRDKGLSLTNLAWIDPMYLPANGQMSKVQMSIVLMANVSEQIDFEIYSQPAKALGVNGAAPAQNSAHNQQEQIHCQGQAQFGAASQPAVVNLNQLQGQMSQAQFAPDALYQGFKHSGLVYGADYQVVKSLALGNNQLLAQLELPQHIAAQAEDYLLHPLLLDGALQAVAAIDGDMNQLAVLSSQSMTAAAVNVFNSTAQLTKVSVWVRRLVAGQGSNASLDIDVCDQYGNVVLQILALSSQPEVNWVPTELSDAVTTDLTATQTVASTVAPVEQTTSSQVMPLAQLQSELTTSLADALYLQASDVGLNKPFVELGLDSIVGVEWVAELNKRYGMEIMATKVYDYPNLGELSQFIHAQFIDSQLESTPAETMVSAPVVQNAQPVDATGSKSLAELQTELTESLADALYLQASDVTLTKPFVDLGLDSIVGVEWVAELNKRYGMEIMATKVYDYPNLGELSQFIHEQFIDSQLELTPAPVSVTTPVLPHVEPVVTAEKKPLAGVKKPLAGVKKPLAGVKKPLAELQTELTESLADALYLQASDVTLTKPFVDLGLDSIVGVEWVAELNKRYGMEIMATKVYDYPNLGELSQFIHTQLSVPANVTAPVEQAVVVIDKKPLAGEKKPLAELQTELTESLADALYLQASDVTLTKPFVDLGLDSIVGVEWVAELNKRYGLEIMATKVYDYPNLGELSAFIHGQLEPQASTQVDSKPIASASVAEPVAELGAVHVQAIAVPVTNKGNASPHQQPQRQARTSIRTMGKGKGLRLAQVNFAPKYDAKYTQLALYSPVCKGNFAQDGEIAIELNLSPQSNIGMHEHVVFGEHLLPTDMYLELVYATAIAYFDIPAPSMTNITLVNPLLGMAGKTNFVKVIFRANGAHDQLQFLVKSSFSADFADEKLHMQGLLQQQSVSGKLMPKLQSAQSQFKPETNLTGNQIVTNKGRYYAPLSKIACANNGALGYIKVAANEFNFAINPLAIYGALGTVINYGTYQVNKQFPVSNELFLPYSIDKLDVLATLSGNDYYCYAETKNVTANSVELYFELLDASYKPVLVVETIRLIRVAPSTIEQQVQGIKQQLASVPVAVAAATGSALNSSELVQQEVAIIGMACRYPMANDVNQFWDNLVAGKDCVTEVSADRWQMSEKGDSQWFNPNNNHPHTAYSKWAGFIDDIDVFDPLFFGISPVEAQVMEPQQRLFLEHSWQCIEDAGYAPSSLSKQACGVYVGCAASDYTKVLADAGQDTVGGAFMGTSTAILAARIAYFLNLKGPAVALDTACSSSLTAVHLAAESIRSGQCQSALAGGVNVLATPFGHILTSQVGMLNAEGGCRTFDASAAGIAFSEGCGVIMLKALSQAEQDNDNILGVLRGSGLNQDGKTNGITAPSGNAQEQLLRQIYQRFDINPQDISYIEAHGTGTPLGDPIEVNALASVFNQHQLAKGSCALGSVKSNIGHAGFAAGMASIIKVLLQLKHKQLVPSIHFNRSNPHIDFAKSPFYVNTETRQWHSDTPRTAAISSFGFSGTNAHVVIGEYANQTQQPEVAGQYMVPISAKSKAQLQQAASQLLDFVEREPQVSLSRLAYTLQAGRDAMDYRMAFLVESVTQLQTVLDIVINGNGKDAAVYQGDVGANRQAMAVFATDEDMQQVISNWQRQRKWTKLIDLWVKGLDIDWHNLYQQAGGHPQRMALPTYPFVKQRIWVEADQAQLNKRQQTNNNTNMIHPLVQQNRSDFATQRFITLLQGHEYWLADHVVDGQKVLPAVAYLEMARAAITQALPEPDIDATLSLHHLAWSQPVVVDDEVELAILLEAQSPEQIEFVVNSNAGEQLHCQGHASLNQASAPIALDIDSLKARTQVATLQGAELYPFFNTMGLDYRNGYQSITQVHLGNSEVLVELELAAGMSDLAQLELHPCMLDSALQGSIVLLAGADLQLSNPILPFALERLDILAPVKAKMFAWVRYSQGAFNSEQVIKVDIDLCDIDGNICVQMHGFSSRPLTLKANQAEQDFDDSYYQKVIEQVLNNELSADEAGELE